MAVLSLLAISTLASVIKASEPLFTLVDPAIGLGAGAHQRKPLGPHRAWPKPAQIRLRSRPHKLYEGKVVRIDIESDSVTEERQVYLSCGDCLKKFNLGEQAEVYVTTTTLDKALVHSRKRR